jgi:HSP20 family protein
MKATTVVFSLRRFAMALIRWEPVAELNTIQNEMNRLFNTFFDQPAQAGRGNGNGTLRRWLPPMDLVETANHYVLRADLPGLSDGDVNIQLEDNVLTISGERNTEHEDQQEGYYRLERAFGAFSRSLTLPDGVDPDHVQARFDRGVLEITVPKPEQKKPRHVQITLGDRPTDDTKTIESNDSGDPQANSHDPVPTPA